MSVGHLGRRLGTGVRGFGLGLGSGVGSSLLLFSRGGGVRTRRNARLEVRELGMGFEKGVRLVMEPGGLGRRGDTRVRGFVLERSRRS